MLPYIVIIIITIIGIYQNRYFSVRMRVCVLFILCTYIILVMGLRYRVGIDTLSYMRGYASIPDLNDFMDFNFKEARFEPGYMLINALCKSVTKEFWLTQLVMAAITNISIFIFLYRYCKNPFVGLLLFFILQWLYFTTEILRESAAVGIFLLNYENLKYKKWIKYYFFSLFSIAFHYSAFIIWFFPLIRNLRINYIYIILCVSFLGITPLAEKLNQLIAISSIVERVDTYIENAKILNLNWRLAQLIQQGIPAIIAVIVYRKHKESFIFKSFVLLQILLCFGAFSIPIIFSRFTNYTTIFVTVSLANLLSSHKIKLYVRQFIFIMIILTQIHYYSQMYVRWVPYVSIFDPYIVKERESMWFDFNH